MQKEIEKGQDIYTIVLEHYRDKEFLLDQMLVPKSQSENLLSLWGQRALTNGTISKEDEELFLEDLSEKMEMGEPVTPHGLKNVYFISLLFNNKFWMIHFIKTSSESTNTTALKDEGKDRALVRVAKEKCRQYEDQYVQLKGAIKKTRGIMKEQRKAEKQMQYWQYKLDSLGKLMDYRNFYTVVFEYTGGIYLNQLYIEDRDLDVILAKWVRELIQKKECEEMGITTQADCLSLIEKVNSRIYRPQPIPNFLNVWGTYLTLSKGLGYITVVKTEQ